MDADKMKLYYGQAMEFHGDSAINHDFEYYDPKRHQRTVHVLVLLPRRLRIPAGAQR